MDFIQSIAPAPAPINARQSNVIARAFDIAAGCGTFQDLKRQLIREGYEQVNAALSSWKIRRKLLCQLKLTN